MTFEKRKRRVALSGYQDAAAAFGLGWRCVKPLPGKLAHGSQVHPDL